MKIGKATFHQSRPAGEIKSRVRSRSSARAYFPAIAARWREKRPAAEDSLDSLPGTDTHTHSGLCVSEPLTR